MLIMATTTADAVRVLTEERDELRGVLRESLELKYTINEAHVNERIGAYTHLLTLLETHRLVPVAVAEVALWVLESDRFDLNHPPRESLSNGWTFCTWSDEEIAACKSLVAILRGNA
jgi:hypothetical protein